MQIMEIKISMLGWEGPPLPGKMDTDGPLWSAPEREELKEGEEESQRFKSTAKQHIQILYKYLF